MVDEARFRAKLQVVYQKVVDKAASEKHEERTITAKQEKREKDIITELGKKSHHDFVEGRISNHITIQYCPQN